MQIGLVHSNRLGKNKAVRKIKQLASQYEDWLTSAQWTPGSMFDVLTFAGSAFGSKANGRAEVSADTIKSDGHISGGASWLGAKMIESKIHQWLDNVGF